MSVHIIEISLGGRRYESVISSWDSDRFFVKTHRQPAATGWKPREGLQALMVSNTVAHRCCNVHGERLVVADGTGLTPEQLGASREKHKSHGKTFLVCPVGGCDVGVWSGSSSLPGTQELRRLRAQVFQQLREDKLGPC